MALPKPRIETSTESEKRRREEEVENEGCSSKEELLPKGLPVGYARSFIEPLVSTATARAQSHMTFFTSRNAKYCFLFRVSKLRAKAHPNQYDRLLSAHKTDIPS